MPSPRNASRLYISLLSTLFFNAYYGTKIGEVSDSLRTPFTPNKDAFRIWGVIYLGQLVHLLSRRKRVEGRNGANGKQEKREEVRFVRLYRRNMDLNQQWLRQFTERKTQSALCTLEMMVKTANDILGTTPVHGALGATMTVYRTWLVVARLQNEMIVLQQSGATASKLHAVFWSKLRAQVRRYSTRLDRVVFRWALDRLDARVTQTSSYKKLYSTLAVGPRAVPSLSSSIDLWNVVYTGAR